MFIIDMKQCRKKRTTFFGYLEVSAVYKNARKTQEKLLEVFKNLST